MVDQPVFRKNLLPARMNPLPDELLSSWLVRLAMAHGLKLHSFSVEIFGKNLSIWNRDIDKSATEKFLRAIAEKTGVHYDRVFQTTLADYAGKIYEIHNSNGNSRWIMPLRIYHRLHRRNGLQICPACLREDSEAYYRREWRLSWITVCEKHEIILLDNCPQCLSPIIFHRQEMGNRNQPIAYSMTSCPTCATIWNTPKLIDFCKKASSESLTFQRFLKTVIQTEWGEINGYGMVHSILYFKGLSRLLRILSTCNKSLNFRMEITRRTGIPLNTVTEERYFDELSVEDRYYTLQAAGYLLNNWATEFIEIAKVTNTRGSILLSEKGDTPFWYWSTVKENISSESFSASEAEICSALSLLEIKSQKQNQFILPQHLKRLTKRRDILRKKSPKFKIKIYQRMKKFNDSLFASECQNSSRNKTILKSRALKRQIYNQHQRVLKNSLEKLQIKERLRWVQGYQKIKSFRIASKKLGVPVSVLRVWYHRYLKYSIKGLVSESRRPKKFGSQKIFKQEEEWIFECSKKGLNITETVRCLKKDFGFEISRQSVKKVLMKKYKYLKLHY